MRALTSRRVAAFGALGTIIISGLASCTTEERTASTSSNRDSRWYDEKIYAYVPPDPTQEGRARSSYDQDQAAPGGDPSSGRERTSSQGRANATAGRSSSPGDQVFFFPSGHRDSSVIQMRISGPRQVQLGEPYSYNLEVTNMSKSPIGDVVVRNVRGETGSAWETGQPALGYTPHDTQTTGTKSGVKKDDARRSMDDFDDDIDDDVEDAAKDLKKDADQARHDANRSTTGTNTMARSRSTLQSETPSTGDKAPAGQPMKNEWVIGHLNPGETKSVKVEGTANEEGKISYCMAVSYSPLACATIDVINPQLQITARGPKEALICDEIEYTYVVRNTGTGVASNVRVMESLPSGATTRDGRREINLPVGDIPAGETREVKVRIKPSERGELRTSAVAKAELGESDPFEFTTLIQQPALQVKINGPQWMYPGGQSAPFEIVVTNTGDGPAVDAMLDFNARGMSGDFSSRNLGRIEPGESKRVSIPLTFARPSGESTAPAVDPGEVRVNATAKARCVESVSGSATTRMRTMPALLLETVDLTDPVQVGQNATYQIAVKNQGSGAAKNVRLTATLPQGLEFVNGSGDSRIAASGKNLNFEPIVSLNPGATAKWTVTAKAVSPGMMQFELKLMSDDLDEAAIESEPTRLFDPNAAPSNEDSTNPRPSNQPR